MHSWMCVLILELCCWLHCIRWEYLAASVHKLRAGEGGHTHLSSLRSEPQPVDTDWSRSLSQTAVKGRHVGEGERMETVMKPVSLKEKLPMLQNARLWYWLPHFLMKHLSLEAKNMNMQLLYFIIICIIWRSLRERPRGNRFDFAVVAHSNTTTWMKSLFLLWTRQLQHPQWDINIISFGCNGFDSSPTFSLIKRCCTHLISCVNSNIIKTVCLEWLFHSYFVAWVYFWILFIQNKD